MKLLKLTTNSVDKAKLISNGMRLLSYPAHNDQDHTEYVCGWVEHSDGRVALKVKGEQTVTSGEDGLVATYSDAYYVHPYADADAFIATLADEISPEEAVFVLTIINSRRGKKLSLAQPAHELPSLAARLITVEEAKEDGWPV